MLGWPASDGDSAIDETPFGPWQATQVVSTLLMLAGGSAADAADGKRNGDHRRKQETRFGGHGAHGKEVTARPRGCRGRAATSYFE